MARTRSVNIGDVFGDLTVQRLYRERRVSGKGWRYMSECLCVCGEIAHVENGALRAKHGTKRCRNCSSYSGAGEKKHGHSCHAVEPGTVEAKCYYTWQAMKRRCLNPSDKRFQDYGGRGIQVCERWRESYQAFLADMGLPPSLKHQIDRRDNDGHYEPGNCAWVGREDNARNKRNNRMIAAFGKTQALVEWAAETGVRRETIARRLDRGMLPEDALSPKLRKPGKTRAVICPAGTFDSISECGRAVNLSISAVFGRLRSNSYPDWRYAE